jgi:ribosomal protein S18 acetylase RimI-like enzyme
MSGWSVDGRARLDPGERSDIEHLREVCEASEPLDLKLELDEADSSGQPIHFLARGDGDLIGYAAITAGVDAEVCGMVHPGWRRRGVGIALLGQVRDAAVRLRRKSVLVICEDSGPVALEWLRRLGARAAGVEMRMTLRLQPEPSPHAASALRPGPPFELRQAGSRDRAALISLLGDGFSQSPEQVADRLDPSDEQTLVAVDGGRVVGTMRLTTTSKRSMIYGFVVEAQRRGQGFGSRMLAATLERLSAQGVTEVGLEVDPENTPAVRLYQAFGFDTVTTYRYMRLASAQR